MADCKDPEVTSHIAVDDEPYSDYDCSDRASSTESLASSLNRYLEENGRHYHTYYGADKNFMPSDETEKERLDIHHEVFRLLRNGRNCSAPVKGPQRVLDLGTGTGIWSVEFADNNRQTEVTGVDLSPIQPKWVPPNCKFEIDDLELDWTFRKNSYDFIHSRNVIGSILDVPKFLGQIYSHLKPGGYVEVSEIGGAICSDDNSIPEDWPPRKAVSLTLDAIRKTGRDFRTNDQLLKLLEDAGFVDIVSTTFKMPMSSWPKAKHLKQAGMLQMVNAETLYHSYGLALFTRVLGMSPEEATKVCDEARDATLFRARKERVHDWTPFYVLYARKPGKATTD